MNVSSNMAAAIQELTVLRRYDNKSNGPMYVVITRERTNINTKQWWLLQSSKKNNYQLEELTEKLEQGKREIRVSIKKDDDQKVG